MTRSRIASLEWSEGLPTLPAEVLTKDGQRLRTDGYRWVLRANIDGGGPVTFNFSTLRNHCSDRFVHIVMLYVVKKARTSSTCYLHQIFVSIKRATTFWFARLPEPHKLNWDDLDIGEFQALLSHGLKSPTSISGADANTLRALYAWGCYAARLGDFNPALSLQLKGMRFPGTLKGQPVLRMDPENGDFITDEIEILDHAIDEGKGDLRGLTTTQLFHELGLRPIQVLRTRWVGLKCYEAKVVEKGSSRVLHRYTLAIPRAKEQSGLRVEETRPISNLLGSRLQLLKPPNFTEETPLLWWLDEMTSSSELASEVRSWAEQCRLTSPRTNKQLKCNPTRFRYTLATEAARDGASKMEIAHLLFHKDLQNVQVYFDAAGTVMDQIESLLEKAFGDHINRFLGKVSRSTDPAPHPGVARRVVPSAFPQFPAMPPIELGLGACGQNVEVDGLCKLAPPITCYRCPKFAAFEDANHQAVLTALENFARTRFGGLADPRVASELILTIVAIRQLLEQISREVCDEKTNGAP